MKKAAMHDPAQEKIGALLSEELAQADGALAGLVPVLTHLLAMRRGAIVTEDVIARIRGMIEDLARQLLEALDQISVTRGDEGARAKRRERLIAALSSSSPLLSHCLAIAVEGTVSDRLARNAAIDPVLPELMSELIASSDQELAALAMAAMAAQARFMEAQRRMKLPLGELPAELFHEALLQLGRLEGARGAQAHIAAQAGLRADYDESASRLGLLLRLGSRLDESGGELDVGKAGLALFASTIAHRIQRPRELVALSCHEDQALRLALMLRGCGLSSRQIARQLAQLDLGIELADELERLTSEQALVLLGTRGE